MRALNRFVMGLGFIVLASTLWGLFKGVYLPHLPLSLAVSFVVGSFMTWKAKYAPEIGLLETAAAVAIALASILLCAVSIGPTVAWTLILIISAFVFGAVGAPIKILISRNTVAWKATQARTDKDGTSGNSD